MGILTTSLNLTLWFVLEWRWEGRWQDWALGLDIEEEEPASPEWAPTSSDCRGVRRLGQWSAKRGCCVVLLKIGQTS